MDPTDVSGDVTVLLDVQPNDETIAGIALTLGDEVIHCRGTSSDQGGFIAAASGQLEVECLFKTADVMGECMGAQLPPLYANGDHTLGARVTTADGETREAIVTQPLTLKNSGFVMVDHSAGSASAVVSGVTYHGGPVDEDDASNQNSFHACPVAYDGTTVGELALTTMMTGPDAAAIDTTVADSTRGATLAITKEMGAFTWNVVPASNGGVENRAGKDEHWVINSGDIKDDGGLLVTSKFRGEAEVMVGPLYFDFKAPTWTHDPDEDAPREILVKTGEGAAGSVAATYYNSGALSVRGLTDGGVGKAAGTIAVGDCGIVANSDSLKSTAFMPAAGLEAVSNMSQLPEEDATKDFADDKGLNCYVGEVTAISDGLGNEATLPGVPIGTKNYFGVDKGAPVVTDVEPDAPAVLKSTSRLSFETEDPDLATGESGSGIWATRWYLGATYRGPFGGSAVSLTGRALGLTKDGAYRVTAFSEDNSSPGNRTRVNYRFTMDTKAPTFTVSKSQSNIGNTHATTVIVSVGGTISDANGIEAAELSVRSPAAGVCPTGAADELNLPARRVTGNKRDLSDDGSKAVTFDETFTVKAPSAGDISGTEAFVSENLCFYLYVEDVATDSKGDGPGNWKEYDVGSFSVNWRNPGPVHRLGAANWTDGGSPEQGAAITDDAPLMVTEGATAQYVVTLTSAPTANVVVSLSAPATVSVDATSVTIDAGTMVSDPITVTAGHDRNVTSEEAVITATASGDANYRGATGSVAVTTADDDFSLSVTPTSVTENTPFASASARLVRVRVQAPMGGTASTDQVQLGASGAGYTFSAAPFTGRTADPYDPTASAITTVTPAAVPGATGLTQAYAWLSVADDLTDDDPELIQIGADPDDEAMRIEPVMMTIVDADPDVTLSIDAVDEGADEVTMTITATAAGGMPGIFEIDADRWAILNEDGVAAQAADVEGYTFTTSGTLTIDRNQTSGTVTVTVSVPEDDDKDDGMFKVGLVAGAGTARAVELSGVTAVNVSVADLTVTVTDNDKDDGNGGG